MQGSNMYIYIYDLYTMHTYSYAYVCVMCVVSVCLFCSLLFWIFCALVLSAAKPDVGYCTVINVST